MSHEIADPVIIPVLLLISRRTNNPKKVRSKKAKGKSDWKGRLRGLKISSA
jgi:hypothetical protein